MVLAVGSHSGTGGKQRMSWKAAVLSEAALPCDMREEEQPLLGGGLGRPSWSRQVGWHCEGHRNMKRKWLVLSRVGGSHQAWP